MPRSILSDTSEPSTSTFAASELKQYSCSFRPKKSPDSVKKEVKLPSIQTLLSSLSYSSRQAVSQRMQVHLPSPIVLPPPVIPPQQSYPKQLVNEYAGRRADSMPSTYRYSMQANTMMRPELRTYSRSMYPYCDTKMQHSSSASIGYQSVPFTSSYQISRSSSSPKSNSSSDYSRSGSFDDSNPSYSSLPRMVRSKSVRKDSPPATVRRRRANLPKKTTAILLSWLNDNLDHPYPTSSEKAELIKMTNLTNQQLSNWFINARRRKIQLLRDIKNGKKK